MAKKKERERERKNIQQLLRQNRDKFNPRTFESLLIKSSNIVKQDALKRLREQIQVTIEVKNLHNQPKITLPKMRQEMQYKNRLTNFNKTGNSINVDNITPTKLLHILNNIDFTLRPTIKIGNIYYTLKPENINKIKKNIDDFFVEEMPLGVGSDLKHFYQLKNIKNVTISKTKSSGKDKNEGAFFKFYNKTDIDLTLYQIYKERQREYLTNCFVNAVIQSDILTETQINRLKNMIKTLYIATNEMSKIAKEFNLYIVVKPIHDNHETKKYGNRSHTRLNVGLIDKHYFPILPTNYTSYSIKNYFDICHLERFNEIVANQQGRKEQRSKDRFIDSFVLIKILYENRATHLQEIPREDILATQYYREVANTEITNLEYEARSVRLNEPKTTPVLENTRHIFFDFETTTEDEHTPYLVNNSETGTEYGENCGNRMLYKLCNKFAEDTLILIAHNAGYDFTFIQPYLQIDKMIKRGKSVLQAEGRFYYSQGKFKKIIIKDSYALISMPLSKFGKAFNLDCKKDIMPYNLYTRKNVDKRYIDMEECREACKIQVRQNNLGKEPTSDDYNDYIKEFISNCISWGVMKNGLIDIVEYSNQYCIIDVQVLQTGYEKFRQMVKDDCSIDVLHCISSAHFANTYMLNKGVFDDVYELSDTPRDFIMKCMVGGRVMTRCNEKQWHQGKIQDFDAVSLYPSAMSRLGGYLRGRPKVLTTQDYNVLKKYDGYFIRIEINNVGKEYSFPLMSYKDDTGNREWTNNMQNKIMYVDKIQLEDLIQFHEIEFNIIDGYYFDEGRNNKLKEVIDYLFLKRLELKSEENCLEMVYKLIMNSSYGKTLQKPIGDKLIFKSINNLPNYLDKNYNYIEKIEEIKSDGYWSRYMITRTKSIEDHFNNCHCGVEVLSMSKRIMNEVMCLAEDNGLSIYYQDTDSMHLPEKDIPKLRDLYMEKYSRELIGKDMGQFHSDFESKVIKKNIYAKESIFLGKKCYIDILEGEDNDGNVVNDHHIRMKGVSTGSILYKSKIEERSELDIYKSLYNGNREEFDLACDGNKCCFNFHSNFSITSKPSFLRQLAF